MNSTRSFAAAAAALGLLASTSSGAHSTAPAEQTQPHAPLQQLAQIARDRGTTAALAFARTRRIATHDELVRVVVEGDAGPARAAVAAADGEITGRAGQLTEALIPPAAATALARAPGVDHVRTPLPSAPQGTESEGVASAQAPTWHGAGARGAGAKVAVVDLGFAGLQSRQAAGELPADIITVDFCDEPMGGGEPHGTVVAEIVHEMAPEAKLYAICAETEVDLANAIAYVRANGVTIVNHSVVWFNSSRGDGSGVPGTPDAIAADARANGVLWVNAAGNAGQRHWHGAFMDADADGRHEFAGADETNGFAAPSGRELCLYLKWDRWPTTSLDLELSLLNAADGAVLETSDAVQDGSQPPAEALCHTNLTPVTQQYALLIGGPAEAAGVRLDIFGYRSGAFEHLTPAESILEPASSPATLAVGAICWQGDVIEDYSSRGPTVDGRVKPDLAGPAGVTTALFGPFAGCGSPGTTGFVGTSASAPHVAGAAALLQGMFPLATAAELQAWLEADAVDLGSAGRDTATGAGKLRLPTSAPEVTTQQSAPVAETTETLDVGGLVSPRGLATTYRWEYGPTAAYTSQTAGVALAGPRGSQQVSGELSGLQPDTVYHYRLVATNLFGTSFGVDRTRRTAPPLPPQASTGPVQDVSHSSALVTGSVQPRGTATTATVEWGSTAAYGQVTPPLAVGATGTQSVSFALVGLAPDTEYHYRVVATSSRGTATGADVSFRTPPASPPPSGGSGGGGGSQPSAPAPQVPPAATAPATSARAAAPGAPKTLRGGAGPNTLRGGSANDRLYGLGGNDRLYGGAGDDRLFGGAGNDRLDGGKGKDSFDGGPGADAIAGRDGARDTIRCGPGRDTVVADRVDMVARDCERVSRPRTR